MHCVSSNKGPSGSCGEILNTGIVDTDFSPYCSLEYKLESYLSRCFKKPLFLS